MDSIVASALEEICAKGQSGIAIASLWSRLAPALSSSNLDLSPGVKKAVWLNLLNVPSLQFHTKSVCYNADDPAIQSFEDAENLKLKIVGKERFRDNFVGLYDECSAIASISPIQRRALECLAIARTDGITQSELSKEFGIEGNNMFYVMRSLECRGLIVRPDAILRTKEACEDGESKNNSSVAATKLLYLYRYAKHLSSLQRLEITKEERTLESLGNGNESDDEEDNFGRGGVKDDVCVKDYLPQMKAICDKLESAKDKVLVVSDIKQNLGYHGSSSGHKAWRNICSRLKQARVVEEFEAKVNDKVERCLRLIKKLSSNVEPKTLGPGDEKVDGEPLLKFGRRGQRTDQLVDLAFDHQIYDMIDAGESDGILGLDLSTRLGISNKKIQPRLENMCSRFGAVRTAENIKKSKAYRFRTHGNFNRQSSDVRPCTSESINETKISNVNGENKDVTDPSTDSLLECDPSTSEGHFPTREKIDQKEIEIADSHFHRDVMANNELLSLGNPQELLNESRGTVPDAEVDLFSTEMEIEASPERTTPTSQKHPKSRSSQRYACLSSTIDSAQREQRVLERLKDEKFLLRAELYRWLVNFEKDKSTTMDRKTIDRIVNKLQREGHCKCIKINVPVVTNCGGSRIIHAILHPSVHSLLPELHGEIYERLRSFEMLVRGHGSQKLRNNESLPVLNDIQRTQSRVSSDAQAVNSEAMRANGFVLAKMVRAKLLHSFLWSYLTCSPGWNDSLSSGKHLNDLKNPHSACNLFSLEEAIKAIPLELFLQVAGSTQTIDDMMDKCKKGLLLSDLHVHEYKHLMDTRATGRLSLIIDILRRLKLIRLITYGHSVGVKVPHTTFTHALELKPYIEEPQSFVSTSSNSRSLDLRPHIRHDFILSSREAVDEYWQTLEFCYAAVDPRTALHAFPGSAVHEVFVFKSWTSVQPMTAEQRAELLKQIEKKVNLDEKFTFKDCEKIAKDLNLTLEQVLRVYYDVRQKRRNSFQGALNTNGDDHELFKEIRVSSSRKRKRNARVVKCTTDDTSTAKSSDTVNEFGEEQNPLAAHLLEYDGPLGACQEDDHPQTVQEPELNEDNEECFSVISQYAFSKMKPTRQKRFLWTDEADRQLVIQYVRNRVILGPKYQRTDWASLPDLPGPPNTCLKRMASLNKNSKFRRAVMRLCNVLSERYVKYLEKTQNKSVSIDDQGELIGSSSSACRNKCFTDSIEHTQESESTEDRWDDFDDANIKTVLEEVLWYKQIAKMESSKRVGSDWSDQNLNSKGDDESEMTSLATPSDDIPDHGGEPKDSSRKSRCRRLHQKFIKHLNEGISVYGQVYNSLAISSAVELLKLVFLSTSTSPEVPILLAETLRRYSEHDLFAAFSYLKEKKFMAGGDDSPFILSQHFMQRVSRSPFPAKTGERAAKFSSWLHEREKDLIEGGVDLTADLQCGDIFHLFALISSGELSFSPCLPEEGVGEAEDVRGLKRKSDKNESYDGDKAKKLKSLNDAELISRREKGFPGIVVSIHRAAISKPNLLDLFKNREPSTADLLVYRDDESSATLGGGNCSNVSRDDHIDFSEVRSVPLSENSSQSLWEVITRFAEHLMLKPSDEGQVNPLHPEDFQGVCTAIQKAGDQGLSVEEVSIIIDVPGEKIPELVIDVLQAFGRVLKVNAHDYVRVVDALYRSKYLLTPKAGFSQDHEPPSTMKTIGSTDDSCLTQLPDNHDTSIEGLQKESVTVGNVHKVTILNRPNEVPAPLNEIQSSNVQDGCVLEKVGKPDESCHGGMPILPWMNGDGNVNSSVFNGLTHRVLGIVMQNPGILEDDIIRKMDVLNPQSCRTLLNSMILDKHLIVRRMLQSTSGEPPSILSTLFGRNIRKPKFIFREHYFANPMSTSFL